MMKKKEGLGDILDIMLGGCGVNLGGGGGGGGGEEEDGCIRNEEGIIGCVEEDGVKVCKLGSGKSGGRVRKRVDGVKGLLVWCCGCSGRDLDIFDERKGVGMWKWMKIV
ncbi:hypothetical protein ACRFB9_28355 [Klebsiella pneumoniae]